MIDFNAVFSFAIAFLVSFAALPLVRVFAFRINAVDIPKDKRRMHKKPIPLLGGIAIFAGFAVSVASFANIIDNELLGVLIGSFIMVVTGVIDDKYDMPAIVKLAAQAVAAAVAIAFGVQLRIFTHPFHVGNSFIDLSYLSIPATFIWIILMTNAINLIDGLDGLAVSVSAISAGALLFLGIVEQYTVVAVPLAAVVGACAGFLPYNRHPAKIFMGDSGALFLGYILATLSVIGFFRYYSPITYVVPVIVLGVPIFDTSFAIIRRIVKHKGIMEADRGHLHHRLIDMGFRHRDAVTILSMMSALLSMFAIVMASRGIKRSLVILIVMIGFAISIKVYQKNNSVAKQYMEELESSEDEEDNKE